MGIREAGVAILIHEKSRTPYKPNTENRSQNTTSNAT